ncbi:MAG: HD domain-containing protein [Alphaproteobacteria bacterium]|nr:HD domain-containing protein [Alphaproteobacteria bacterium SS10]
MSILDDSTIALEFIEFIEQRPHTVNALMRRVLSRCRELTRAQAGTVFIVRKVGRQRMLQAISLQNDLIKMGQSTFSIPINNSSIAGYVAETGEVVFIDDTNHLPAGAPYTFNRKFDEDTGFNTQSIMAFPITNFEGKIIGVAQLINAQTEADEVCTFNRDFARVIQPVNNIIGRAIERAEHTEKLQTKNAQLRRRNKELRDERERVEMLRAETESALMTTVDLLARAAELHDDVTGKHVSRVGQYSAALADFLGMSKAFVDEIRYCATLHDVGKMSVNQAILHKPGRLTDAEFDEMKLHTTYGFTILEEVDRLKMAADIALSHHERWDGGGYPNRISGEEIPMAARIVCFADIYDALRSVRPYKKAFSHQQSIEIMLKGDDRLDPSKHFDPKLLELFCNHHQVFGEIYHALADEELPAAE